MIRIIAYQIAENTNIKKLKSEYTGNLINHTSFELFIKFEQGYIFVLNYGIVVFANVDEIQRNSFIQLLKAYCVNHLENHLQEDFVIEKTETAQPLFSYNSLLISCFNSVIFSKLFPATSGNLIFQLPIKG